jgi:glycosyltransferase involved in cell wall biosynthesis
VRVLHVITSGARRGGDVFASDLVDLLRREDVDQRVAVLRRTEGLTVPFAVPVMILGSGRWSLPGVNMDLFAAMALRRIVTGWRPDIVQAHGGEPYKYALAATARRQTPVIYRRIGGAPSWIRRGARRLVHAQLMRRAGCIVAVADAVRQETIALFGVDPSRIVVIPNGVSVDRIQSIRGRTGARDALGIPEDAVVVLSLGALTWEKDPMTHLEIAAKVIQMRQNAVHLFVGDGPLRHQLENRIEELGLSGRCHVLGSRSELGDIFAASDVLLFASRADGMEGMPATIIEAGMAGLPVAAYSIMGVPEVIQHGVTGLLAPAGDVRALTTNVVELIDDPKARGAMGVASRRLGRTLFDIERVVPRYLDVYSNLVEADVSRQRRNA